MNRAAPRTGAAGRAAGPQCGARVYSFVVHGLWPQYEKGFPEYCQVPAPRLDRTMVSSMLDLMPAPHLIFSEWDRHGTCSGLSPRAYFETVRKARAVVKIPPEYMDLQEPLSVTPAAVEDAFIKANPGLSQGDIAVACDSTRLTEVRLCLSKELQFRDCPEVAAAELPARSSGHAAAARLEFCRWRQIRVPRAQQRWCSVGEFSAAAMNYQHAFHAGNFADVHKHAVLARILVHLRRKPAAFRVIDTHAGAGRYDLLAAEPNRSGEWRDGIKRIWDARAKNPLLLPPPPGRGLLLPPLSLPRQGRGRGGRLLAPYLDAVAALNPDGKLRTYPGSPLIAQSLLRPQDRLIACELEPRSAASLAAALRGDRRAKALAIDGWTALCAYVPPKERRGLVLVDPPFEDAADFMRLSGALAAAHRKWPTGIYMLWYPIKAREAPDALARRLQRLAIAKVLRCEIMLGPPRADARLVGSGLIVVNPPFTLDAELRILLPALGRMLSPQAALRLDWLTPDR